VSSSSQGMTGSLDSSICLIGFIRQKVVVFDKEKVILHSNCRSQRRRAKRMCIEQ
jgi:hypothetical protein